MKNSIFMHYRPDERPFVTRMMELAERAEDQQLPTLTDFLDPRQCRIAKAIAASFSDVNISEYAGHKECERQRVILAPSWHTPEVDEFCIQAVRIEVVGFTAAHGDYLGAILGLGIKREKVGDLFVHEQFCDCMVTQEMAPYIAMHLTGVGRARISVSLIEPDQVMINGAELDEKDIILSSLRLDTVVAEVFGMSRTKSTNPIHKGLVKVNFGVVDDPAFRCEEGDVISLRGAGRARILEIGSTTRKGNAVVRVGRYR